MTTTGPVDETGDRELDSIAWEFLCSPFTGRNYWDWSLERRLDAYLRHHDLERVLNDGAAYAIVVDRVMANLGRARRDGVLAPPHS